MKKNIPLIIALVVSAALLGVLIWLCWSPSDNSAQTPPDTAPATTAQTEPTPPVTTAPAQTEPPTTEAEYIPQIQPDAVGIYIPADNGTRDRRLITELTAPRTAKKDIDCFEVFASTQETITGTSFSGMWKEVWDAYEDTENAKIGFILQFETTGGESVSQVILKPSDAKSFYDYLEVYLYDDINQTPGVRYTHLEDSEITDDTVISSIKLTSGSRIDEVGDILLTAFIYNGDDCFDADGNYIGLVSATIIITEGE